MTTLPQRKAQRLSGYDYCAAGAYFITICAKNRRCLFGSIAPVDADAYATRSTVQATTEASPTGVGGDACIAPQVALTPLGRIVQKHLANIPGVTEFVVMPNHLHCLIVVPSYTAAGGPMQASAPTERVETISQRIRVFKGCVAHEAGPGVFQRSFYDHIVRGETEYREICEYIQNNPARWAFDKFYIEGE